MRHLINVQRLSKRILRRGSEVAKILDGRIPTADWKKAKVTSTMGNVPGRSAGAARGGGGAWKGPFSDEARGLACLEGAGQVAAR